MVLELADLYRREPLLLHQAFPGATDGYQAVREQAESWFSALVILHDHGGINVSGKVRRIDFRGDHDHQTADQTWIVRAILDGRLKRTDDVVDALARKAISLLFRRTMPPVNVVAEIADTKGRTVYRVHVSEGN